VARPTNKRGLKSYRCINNLAARGLPGVRQLRYVRRPTSQAGYEELYDLPSEMKGIDPKGRTGVAGA
jgi:hypothetical protein